MVKFAPISIICILLLSNAGKAQIPNPGFENWTGSDPDGWASGNAPEVPLIPVTKVADAHTGNWALRGTIIPIPGTSFAMSAAIQTGAGGTGFAVSARHAVVTGYYKCSLLSGDMLGLNFGMYQSGNALAVGAEAITTSTSTWTPFSVPFVYQGPETPDNCILQIQIFGPGSGADYHLGSWYQVDDLAFSGASGVSHDTRPSTYSLEQNFPNPFNPTTTIRYSLAHRSQVTLAVFNLIGEKVATLVNEMQESGTHDARFDASGLASGTYFYRLMAGAYVETRQLVLMR